MCMKNKSEDKEYRKQFLDSKPIKYTFFENKHFNNLVDFNRFVAKHRSKFVHNNRILFGGGSHYVYYSLRDEEMGEFWPFSEVYHSEEMLVDLAKNINGMCEMGFVLCDEDHEIRMTFTRERLENATEVKSRMALVEKFSQLSTKELLSAIRGNRYYGYTPGIPMDTLKAVLDTREHVLRASGRKAIRLAKAKLQKRY